MADEQQKASTSAHVEAIRRNEGTKAAHDSSSTPDLIILEKSSNGTRPELSLPLFLEPFRGQRQWVVMHVWKERPSDARYKKRPINPTTGHAIDATNETNRLTWDEAAAAVGPSQVIAFYLDESTNITVVDLDECFQGDALTSDAFDLIHSLKCPVERSFSGNGIHAYVKASLPNRFSSKNPAEVYQHKRLMVVTGDFLPGFHDRAELPDRTEVVLQYVTEQPDQPADDAALIRYPECHTDDEIMRMIRNSPKDYQRFRDIVDGDWQDRSQGVWHMLTFFSDFTISVDQCARLTNAAPVADLGKWSTRAHNRETTLKKLMQHKAADWAIVHAQRLQGTLSNSNQRFSLMSLSDVLNEPPPTYLIDDYVRERAVGMIFGESGIGKSLLVLDIVMHVAIGLDWHGNALRKSGPVLYFVAEGREELPVRVAAWLKAHGIAPEVVPNVQFITQTASLQTPTDAEALHALIAEMPEPPVLVFIDTLSLSMIGGDENSTKDMMEYVRTMMQIRDSFGSAVYVVHHPRKDGLVERGSGSLRNACQSILEVKRLGDDGFTLEPDKRRDGMAQQKMAFQHNVVELPEMQINYGSGDVYIPTGATVVLQDLPHAMFREGMKDQKKMDDRILEALENAAEEGLTDKELLAALDIKQSNGTYRKNRDLLVERGKALSDKPEGAKGRRFWLAEHAPEQNLIGDLNGDV